MRQSLLLNVPRESRDTLLLLAVIAWTLLPHAWHLPWWCIVLTSVLLLWRASLAWGARRLPPTAVRTAMLALAVGLTWWSFGTVIGKDPGVTLLVMLVVIKTLELRARRDALVVFFLGFFLIVTNFFYSQSLPVAVAMLLSVWGLLTALVLANIPSGRPSLRQAGTIAARMAAWSLPVMVLMFVIFPRIGPLWGTDQAGKATTGLSNTLRMGGIAELVNNDAVAFRVRFSGTAPPSSQLYFRGPVLTRFDGQTWRPAKATDSSQASVTVQLQGPALPYQMVLEPSDFNVVPMLEWTGKVDGAAWEVDVPRLMADMQWKVARPITERMLVTAVAHPHARYGVEPTDAAVAESLVVPLTSNPRTVDWAQRWIESDPTLKSAEVPAIVDRLLAQINAGYTYTLSPGTYGEASGRGAIDEFWLDRREGFCEHFASTTVFILRTLGIPARIVTGYQGADTQLQDGWHVVRQLNAHAWIEVWTPDRGWWRVDPTAAVAPERVSLGATLRPAPSLMSSMLQSIDPSLLPNLRHYWETAQLRWNRWVVQYSRGQQFDLLKKLGVHTPTWEHLVYALIALLTGASLAGAVWAWIERRRRDPWERLQSDMREQLQHLGIEAQLHDAPRILARRVRTELGTQGEAVAQALDALDRHRYATTGTRRPDPRWWPVFAKAVTAASRRATISAFSTSVLTR